jgi:hypothetical protein
MWRVMKKVIDLKTNIRNLVNSRKANAMARTWRTGSEVKGKARARHLHVIKVVVQIILPDNVEPINIWLNYTKKSLKESNNNKRSYETHFNNMTKEASTSGTLPSNPKMTKLMDNDNMDIENTIVEYHSNDVYGDLKYAHLSLA